MSFVAVPMCVGAPLRVCHGSAANILCRVISGKKPDKSAIAVVHGFDAATHKGRLNTRAATPTMTFVAGTISAS